MYTKISYKCETCGLEVGEPGDGMCPTPKCYTSGSRRKKSKLKKVTYILQCTQCGHRPASCSSSCLCPQVYQTTGACNGRCEYIPEDDANRLYKQKKHRRTAVVVYAT